jgi:hypothetical protein
LGKLISNFLMARIKLHASFNLETVEAFVAMQGTEHEGKHLVKLLDKFENVECFVADLSYLSRRNCPLTAEKRGIPYY